MSVYQYVLIGMMALVVIGLVLAFKRYMRMPNQRQQSDHRVRAKSSLAKNTDLDSDAALVNPISVNEDLLVPHV